LRYVKHHIHLSQVILSVETSTEGKLLNHGTSKNVSEEVISD